MLTRAILRKRNFSLKESFENILLGRENKEMQIINSCPKKLGSPVPVNFMKPRSRELNQTKLANGVTVMSQSTDFPGTVSMGVLMDVGSKHETPENSGSLYSIKNTYYKSNLNTNETINYNMVQMAGGKYDMSYNREQMVFKATCLPHDATDLMAMLSDCSLEPRTSVCVNASIPKIKSKRIIDLIQNPGLEDTDRIMREMYGEHGLGMPILGNPSNYDMLNSYLLQKFQIDNISSDKLIVAGVGIENHNEFVELANIYFGDLRYSQVTKSSPKPVFNEFEVRIPDEKLTRNEIYLLFESASFQDSNFVLSHIAREFFGSADAANPSNQIKNRGVLVKDIFESEKSVMSIEAMNMSFKETGFFGFRIGVNAESSNKVLDKLLKILTSLDKLKDEDLLLAKKRLVNRVLEATMDDYLHVEEMMKQQSNLGDMKLESMIHEIEKVDMKAFVSFMKKILGSKASLYVRGSHPSSTYSLDKIKKALA